MTNGPVRYATEDIYADIEEEGGVVNRLVAVKGQPVPAAYARYVPDKKTTTDIDKAHALAQSRSTSGRRAAGERAADVAEAEAAGEPPYEGYDDLSVDDVVKRLDGASAEEVAVVKAYEAAHKDRKGIAEYEPAEDSGE